MRQTLTDDFGGLHKNMNCAFPLNPNKAYGHDMISIRKIKICGE